MRSIEEMRKDLAIHLYGQTKEEAQQAHVCINCGQEIFGANNLMRAQSLDASTHMRA